MQKVQTSDKEHFEDMAKIKPIVEMPESDEASCI
jgi:hypothetical protein